MYIVSHSWTILCNILISMMAGIVTVKGLFICTDLINSLISRSIRESDNESLLPNRNSMKAMITPEDSWSREISSEMQENDK